MESIVFRRGVTREELEQLVWALAADPELLAEEGGIGRVLEAHGVERISVGRTIARSVNDWRAVHSAALDVLRGASQGARTGKSLDVAQVQNSVRDIVDNVLGDRSLLCNLTSLKGMDEYTFVHTLNICVLAGELGRQISLEREQLDKLVIATLLHDVGKILVPLEILRKPGPLDEQEFQLMSRHPVDGAVLLTREPQLPEVAALVAYEHHMRCDFSGYPTPAAPRTLHLYSLICCIADIYDALTTSRPYRPPLTPLDALEVMSTIAAPMSSRACSSTSSPYWVLTRGERCSVCPTAVSPSWTRPNALAPDNPFARPIDTDAQPPRAASEETPINVLAGSRGAVQVLNPVALGLDLTALLHRVHAGDDYLSPDEN